MRCGEGEHSYDEQCNGPGCVATRNNRRAWARSGDAFKAAADAIGEFADRLKAALDRTNAETAQPVYASQPTRAPK